MYMSMYILESRDAYIIVITASSDVAEKRCIMLRLTNRRVDAFAPIIVLSFGIEIDLTSQPDEVNVTFLKTDYKRNNPESRIERRRLTNEHARSSKVKRNIESSTS